MVSPTWFFRLLLPLDFPMICLRRLVLTILLGLFAFGSGPVAVALVAPQDNWFAYPTASWPIEGRLQAMAINRDSELFVVLENRTFVPSSFSIEVYSTNGAHLRQFLQLNQGFRAISLAFLPGGELVALCSDSFVRVYGTDGTLLNQWGGPGFGGGWDGSTLGTITGSIMVGSRLAVDAAGQIYVCDPPNNLVKKFSPEGAFILQWGGFGTLPGQFGTTASNAMGVVVLPDGNVVVASSSQVASGRFLQMFTPEGAVLPSPLLSGTPQTQFSALLVTPDGLVLSLRGTFTLFREGLEQGSVSSIANLTFSGGAAVGPNGDIYAASLVAGVNSRLHRLERAYAGENPLVRNAIPQPTLLATEQRPSSPYVDIDYRVTDVDNPVVHVGLLGFVNGADNLRQLLPMRTFVENTASRVGPAQPTNETRRVTWHVAADWAVELGEVQIEILARDERELLPVHWITVPAEGGAPAVQLSRMPVTERQWLDVWYWLLATGEPGFVLQDGAITGSGGAFHGQILAQTVGEVSTTTAAGRAFLSAKCGVRVPTAGELVRAGAALYGFTQINEFLVARDVPAAPAP